LPQKRCPFDQNTILRDITELPVNYALLQLVGAVVPEMEILPSSSEEIAKNNVWPNLDRNS
jgi:RING finger/CCCH-type zinc finger protein